jgi:hypothetical protein
MNTFSEYDEKENRIKFLHIRAQTSFIPDLNLKINETLNDIISIVLDFSGAIR